MVRFRPRKLCILGGALLALLYLPYLYLKDASPGPVMPHPLKLGPRHPRLLPHPDVVNDEDEAETGRLLNLKRGPVIQEPGHIELRELGIIHTPEDQKIRDEGYRIYAFNLLISDRIGNHRSIPDTRHRLCKSKAYPTDLPKASIVICYYNEAPSALLRTLHSVLDRSPASLIHEIILVDDFSDNRDLMAAVSENISASIPQVKLFRNDQREGLIRSRVIGADHATGKVIVFLDSHCEVNVGWLEPLLAHVNQDPHNIAIPIIDIINHDTFVYEESPLVRGGFNWGLHFRWDGIPTELLQTKDAYANPIKTPTMAGGLFAVDRQYFHDIGKYDEGMDIWGGENLEISFRVWQCGGRLDLIPCSRVGHIFRQRRPYGSPDGKDTMLRNSLRLAHVWMDDYIEYFYKLRPNVRNAPYGVIDGRVALREALGCESFKWYLENVYPEQSLPDDSGHGGAARIPLPHMHAKAKILHSGLLIHRESGLCVGPDGDVYQKKALLKLVICDPSAREQIWSESEKQEFQLANTLCLDVDDRPPSEPYPRLMKCHGSGGTQQWDWHGRERDRLLNSGSGLCLGVVDAVEGSHVSMAMCGTHDEIISFQFGDVVILSWSHQTSVIDVGGCKVWISSGR